MIHSTALIDPSSTLHPTVRVGAYTIIGADVHIGEGTDIGPHCVITGPCTIGRNNKIHSHAESTCKRTRRKGPARNTSTRVQVPTSRRPENSRKKIPSRT